MILYRYLSAKELEQWQNEEFRLIDCRKDKNNNGKVSYDGRCMYFTKDITELKAQRRGYLKPLGLGEQFYLCTFKIPTAVIRKNKENTIYKEFGYEGSTRTINGILKCDLKSNWLYGYQESSKKADVELINSAIGLVELDKKVYLTEIVGTKKTKTNNERVR